MGGIDCVARSSMPYHFRCDVDERHLGVGESQHGLVVALLDQHRVVRRRVVQIAQKLVGNIDLRNAHRCHLHVEILNVE